MSFYITNRIDLIVYERDDIVEFGTQGGNKKDDVARRYYEITMFSILASFKCLGTIHNDLFPIPIYLPYKYNREVEKN